MGEMTVRKAERDQNFLRMFIDGPAGSGKTYTALRLAFGLGKKVCVIDTQNGSSKLYAGDVDADGNRFDFFIIELDFFSAESYIEAIQAAEKIGAEVIIIDSLSHAWDGTGGTLEFVGTYKEAERLNAWNVATVKQRKLINAMLGAKAHVIATMRTKTRINLKRTKRDEPAKVTKRVQKDGIEYEFDLGLTMNGKNTGTIIKTHSRRLPMFETFERPGKELSERILNWLHTSDTAKTEPPKPEQAVQQQTKTETDPAETGAKPYEPLNEQEPPEENRTNEGPREYSEDEIAKMKAQVVGALRGVVITLAQYEEWRSSKYIPTDKPLTGEELELLLADITHKMKTGRWEPTPF